MPIADHSQTLPLLRRTYASKTSPKFAKWRQHRPRERGKDHIRQLGMRLHRRANLRSFSSLQEDTTDISITEWLCFFVMNVILMGER